MPGKTAPFSAGKQATFKIHSNGAVKAYKRQNPSTGAEEYIIEGVASSNVRDRHGDTITERAQHSMLRQAQGLTMFMNHSYKVPEDVLGTCEYSTLERNGDILDLVTRCNVAQTNPRAMDCWRLINEDKIKLGQSIGGNITESQVDEENDDGESWCPPLIIDDIELLEISLCGIPANPRAYTRDFVSQMARGYMRSATRSPKVRELVRKALSGKAHDADLDAILERALASDDPVKSALAAIDESGMHEFVKDWLQLRGEENARKLLGDDAYEQVAKAVGLETTTSGEMKTGIFLEIGDASTVILQRAGVSVRSVDLSEPEELLPANAMTLAVPDGFDVDAFRKAWDDAIAIGDIPALVKNGGEYVLNVDLQVSEAAKAALEEAHAQVDAAKAEVENHLSQRDALKAEVDALEKQRGETHAECEALLKTLAELKATPTGRQSKTATSGGSSGNAAAITVDLTKLTAAELLEYKRKLLAGMVPTDGRSFAQ
jgi:HK97 family phage prohead protease